MMSNLAMLHYQFLEGDMQAAIESEACNDRYVAEYFISHNLEISERYGFTTLQPLFSAALFSLYAMDGDFKERCEAVLSELARLMQGGRP